jgi:hypothetical protein
MERALIRWSGDPLIERIDFSRQLHFSGTHEVIADRNFTMVQDFIGGRLSDDECRAFEDRLVRDPRLARELEQSLRMREGLQQLRTRGYIRNAASSRSSFWNWVPATLAAATIAGLALFLLQLRVAGPSPLLTASPEARIAGNAAAPLAAQFTFITVRGGSVPDLILPPAGLIEIRAVPSVRENVERFRMTLVSPHEGGAAQTVASLTGLTLGTDGYVHSYADASRLAPGSYVLRIQPDTDTPGPADVFPFNLRAGAERSR